MDASGDRFLALAIAGAAMLWVGIAHAQTSARWFAPHNDFSIELGTHGWRVLDRSASSDLYDGEIIIAAPNADPRADSRCSVEVLSRSAPQAPSRELMNQGTRELMESPTVSEMRNHEAFRLDRVEVDEIDGIATLDIYGRFMDLQTVQRRFFLHRDGTLLMYTFSCSVSGDNPSAAAEAGEIAASLRFAE